MGTGGTHEAITLRNTLLTRMRRAPAAGTRSLPAWLGLLACLWAGLLLPGDLVEQVARQAQRAQEILDVRRLEEFQTPEFDERDPPRGQFDLQQVAVMAGAHQDRMIA